MGRTVGGAERSADLGKVRRQVAAIARRQGREHLVGSPGVLILATVPISEPVVHGPHLEEAGVAMQPIDRFNHRDGELFNRTAFHDQRYSTDGDIDISS
jgi:hypothetical protein